MGTAKKKGKPEILKTRADVANRFNVNARTVSDWLKEDGFPGKTGKAGTATGYFPVAEIERWHADKLAAAFPDESSGSLNEQLKQARLRKLNLENDDFEARFVDIELVLRLMSRTAAMSKQMLYQLVVEVPSILPSDLPEVVKKEIGRLIEQKLNGICSYMAAEFKSLNTNRLVEAEE